MPWAEVVEAAVRLVLQHLLRHVTVAQLQLLLTT